MTQKNSLDLKGIIRAYPVAEVLLEICQAGLSGSLRASCGEQKAIVYFNDGMTVYAVSNERRFRLSEALVDQKAVDRAFLEKNHAVTNDLQLADIAAQQGLLSKEELTKLVSTQCKAIILAMLSWADGEWTYSPHNRARPGISYELPISKILIDYARCIEPRNACARLQNSNQWFELRTKVLNDDRLRPEEAFLLSRLDSQTMTLDQIAALSGLTKEHAYHTVYILWLGGFLSRHGWPAAFTDERIKYLRSADLKPKKVRQAPAEPVARPTAINLPPPSVEPAVEEDVEFDLESCLERIEAANDYYSVLGIHPSAKVVEIRRAYFKLAKMLHPDRHHGESPEHLRRVEKAFTELAQAHETLKSPDSRQGYDIKLRQAERDKASRTEDGPGGAQLDQASADFERGLALQLEGEFEAALPYLARAAHYSPNNARYRAQYGKTLSMDETQRHKAEKELVTAVKLEPRNPAFRLLLAEFFVRNRLFKRAQGELERLLELAPENKEARSMLDSLQGK
jgi:curved DNA-binding protein CbpA